MAPTQLPALTAAPYHYPLPRDQETSEPSTSLPTLFPPTPLPLSHTFSPPPQDQNPSLPPHMPAAQVPQISFLHHLTRNRPPIPHPYPPEADPTLVRGRETWEACLHFWGVDKIQHLLLYKAPASSPSPSITYGMPISSSTGSPTQPPYPTSPLGAAVGRRQPAAVPSPSPLGLLRG